MGSSLLPSPWPISHGAVLPKQERWLEDDAEYWKGPASGAAYEGKSAEVVRGRRYLPFGDGVRSCVGQSLAKMNYTATLALVLSHFSFRLADRVSACAHRCCPQFCAAGACVKDSHGIPVHSCCSPSCVAGWSLVGAWCVWHSKVAL